MLGASASFSFSAFRGGRARSAPVPFWPGAPSFASVLRSARPPSPDVSRPGDPADGFESRFGELPAYRETVSFSTRRFRSDR